MSDLQVVSLLLTWYVSSPFIYLKFKINDTSEKRLCQGEQRIGYIWNHLPFRGPPDAYRALLRMMDMARIFCLAQVAVLLILAGVLYSLRHLVYSHTIRLSVSAPSIRRRPLLHKERRKSYQRDTYSSDHGNNPGDEIAAIRIGPASAD